MSTEKELLKLLADYGKECISAGMADLVADDDVNQLIAADVRKSHDALTTRLRALLTELEAAREDADRYRWLRKQPNDCTAPRIDICHWTCDEGDSVNNGEGLRLEAADKAIDAARQGEA